MVSAACALRRFSVPSNHCQPASRSFHHQKDLLYLSRNTPSVCLSDKLLRKLFYRPLN